MPYLLVALSFLLIFITHPAEGVAVTPFSSKEQKRKVFSIVDSDYEDVRIDYDFDGKIDYWGIKKGDLKIEIYFRPEITIYHIRNFRNNFVDERIIFSKDNLLYMAHSAQRRQFIYNFTTEGPLCPGNQKPEWEKLKETLSQVSKQSLSVSTEKFIGEQCFKELDSSTYKKLRGASAEVFSPPGTSENTLLNCLESSEVQTYFKKTFGENDGALNHEKAIIGFKNSLIRFTELEKSSEGPILLCKKVDEITPKNPMKVTETGKQIQFQVGKNISEISTQEIKAQIFHESLHISSIKNEDLNNAVTNFCVKGEKYTGNIKLSQKDLASQYIYSSSTFTSQLDVFNGETIASESNSQAIPKSIAETPLPPSRDNAPANMNRVAEIGGSNAASEMSRAQTSGVIRMAENILAPTPAIAAAAPSNNIAATETANTSTPSESRSYSSSSYEGASVNSTAARSDSSRRAEGSSRTPASEYQLNMSTVSAKAPTVKIPSAALKEDSVARGEFVREEIDLTKTNSSSSPSPQIRAPASAQATPTGPPSTPPLQNGSSEVTSSGGILNSGPSNRTSSASLGSEPLSSNESRQTSSIRKAESLPRGGKASQVPSRDEVVSFIAGGSYQQARGKLKDETFIQTLKQNNITVYDLGGNTYGAAKGDVIFVDQGDRFVRQR